MEPEPENREKLVYRTVGKVTSGAVNVNDFVARRFVGGANNSGVAASAVQ
jgi:hypothetical protein